MPLFVKSISHGNVIRWMDSCAIFYSLKKHSTGPRLLQGLRFSEVTPTSISVAWEAPLAPVDMFVVNYNPKTHGETQQVIVKGDQNAVALTDLKPGTEYVVTLMALQGTARTEPLVGSVTTGTCQIL